MKPFEDWRNEPETPINESYSEAVRKYMSASTSEILRSALGDRDLTQAKAPHEIEESSLQDIADLENEIKQKIKDLKEEEAIEAEETYNEEIISNKDYYSLYRDREETFECNITISGASLAAAQARLIIDTPLINLVYYGKLYKDGRCLVQLGKITSLPEETRGRIRLEVIVDDTLFIPWESSCVVEGSKKVTVDIKGKKSVSVNMGTV